LPLETNTNVSKEEDMTGSPINRKKFLADLGICCVGSCVCALMGGVESLRAQDSSEPAGGGTTPPRSEARIAFAEQWAVRFFGVLDATVDADTRKKVMMANGRACFQNWIKETGQQIKPITLEEYAKRVKEKVKDDSVRVDGNTIYFQFNSAAETGLPSTEGACLCPLVETKPAGLSGTYCVCSIGYMKEWFDQMFGRPVTVELLESTLMGGKRCRFKITVA
jgi:predicted hydrocarbon binding protein